MILLFADSCKVVTKYCIVCFPIYQEKTKTNYEWMLSMAIFESLNHTHLQNHEKSSRKRSCARSEWFIEIPRKIGPDGALVFKRLQIDSLTSYHFRSVGVRWLFAHQGRTADVTRQDFQPQSGGIFTGSSNRKAGVRPGFEPLGIPRKSLVSYNQLLLLVYRVFGTWRWILRIQTKLPKNGLWRR